MLCGIEHIDIERKSRLGLLGELLAEEWLPAAGFKDVENLNRKVRNCPFGDILATRNGTRFFIGVKSRNVLIRADKKAQLEGADRGSNHRDFVEGGASASRALAGPTRLDCRCHEAPSRNVLRLFWSGHGAGQQKVHSDENRGPPKIRSFG
jgi:hypothetical protein